MEATGTHRTTCIPLEEIAAGMDHLCRSHCQSLDNLDYYYAQIFRSTEPEGN